MSKETRRTMSSAVVAARELDVSIDLELNRLSLSLSYVQWDHSDRPSQSERELVTSAAAVAATNMTEPDYLLQLCRLISYGINFASSEFNTYMVDLPRLINTIRSSLVQMKQSTQQFSEIADDFGNLVRSLVNLVAMFKRHATAALPHLQQFATHMRHVMNASEVGCSTYSSSIRWALDNMFECIEKLADLARAAWDESSRMSANIGQVRDSLKSKLEGKVSCKLRNAFSVNVACLANLRTLRRSMVAVGVGALLVGGVSAFVRGDKLRTTLISTAATLGGFGAVDFNVTLRIMSTLWQQNESDALAHFKDILEMMNALKNACVAFTGFMKRSEAKITELRTDFASLEKEMTRGCPTQRRAQANVCLKGIELANGMIASINVISHIDLGELSA